VLVESQTTVSHRSIVDGIGDAGLKERLESAALLVLPGEGHAGYLGPVFPAHAGELISHLAKVAGDQFRVEVASADAEYRELALHADIWYLPVLLLADATLGPIVVNMVSSFLYDNIRKLLPGRKAEVRSELLIDRAAGTLSLKYDGPAETYETVMIDALRRNGMSQE
jgi:hypothetical protein